MFHSVTKNDEIRKKSNRFAQYFKKMQLIQTNTFQITNLMHDEESDTGWVDSEDERRFRSLRWINDE